MKFDIKKYEENEKLIFNIGMWILISGIGLFILTVFTVERFEFIEPTLRVIAALGLVASIGMVVAGNIRLLRYLIVIRKENTDVVVWKSAIAIAFGLTSLVVYWFIFLILVLSSF